MTSTPTAQQQDQFEKIRLLLALWFAEGNTQEVKKSLLTSQLKRKQEKAANYQGIYTALKAEGAIAITTKKRTEMVSLTDEGMQMLIAGLHNPEFEFGGQQVGTRIANALLKWIRQQSGTATPATQKPSVAADGQGGRNAIATIPSYEAFKPLALAVYDQLNRDYNLDDLVPIYRMRREIGERVTRSQFNDWMLQMQADDILQLLGASLTEQDPAAIEDSISTQLSGLRCYAKRLTS